MNASAGSFLFTLHSRHWRENTYVYPVVSRRSKGLSIGVNLNPDRICNFSCVYCCVNRTDGDLRPLKIDLNLLAAELDAMLDGVASGAIWRMPPFDQTPAHLRRFNDVAFSGDGEPTSSPAFAEACRLAVGLLEKHRLDAKIVVITNATLFHHRAVRDALAYLDQHQGEIWAKLDAGSQRLYDRIVRSPIPLQKVLDNILAAGRVRPLVIQSMFLRTHGQPPEPGDITDYIHRLKELLAGGCQIKLVQVYTLARPVFEAQVTPAPDALLDEIARRVRDEGIEAEAYYAAAPSDS